MPRQTLAQVYDRWRVPWSPGRRVSQTYKRELCLAKERALSQTFFRQELFDLVWSEPTRTVAKRLGISDVGGAKVADGLTCRCHRVGIGQNLRLEKP